MKSEMDPTGKKYQRNSKRKRKCRVHIKSTLSFIANWFLLHVFVFEVSIFKLMIKLDLFTKIFLYCQGDGGKSSLLNTNWTSPKYQSNEKRKPLDDSHAGVSFESSISRDVVHEML